jgi:hypothetical protein
MLASALAQAIAPPDPGYAEPPIADAGHGDLGADPFAAVAEPSVRRSDAGAATIVLFVAGYIVFQRQEVRA